MRMPRPARATAILALSTVLVFGGCDGVADGPETETAEPGEAAGENEDPEPTRVRLGVGYSTVTAPGGDSYIISIDLVGEANTTYDVRVYKSDSPSDDAVEITTNERGVGSGTKRVTERGTYIVEVRDQNGVLVLESLEVE